MSPTSAKAWNGGAFLSYGFRPFFLLGALYAALAVAVWTPWFLGMIGPRSALPPPAWHAHSLLFGYVWAAVAGFLLTAVPNWTGRTQIKGWPLLALVLAWMAGRLVISIGAGVPAVLRMAVDLAFPLALIAAIAREIAAAKNWRNGKIIGVLCLLVLAQAWFHYEIERHGAAYASQRLAITTIIMLIGIIGGRIIPAFTTNWLKSRGSGRLPRSFGKFDAAVMAATAIAFATWVIDALYPVPRTLVGPLMLLAGLANFVRQWRWAPERTLPEPLVAVLHVAYAFIGLGLLLTGVSEWTGGRIASSAGIHAFTSGAVGTMTLAVMTRASLGHTGQKLAAGPVTIVIYLAVILAALVRIAAALLPSQTLSLIPLAGGLWIAAFLLFAIGYGPSLIRPRPTS